MTETPMRALGAMSGTSLDGIDAAVVVTDGVTLFERGPGRYRAYSEEERGIIRASLGVWDDTPATEAAAEVVETGHADLLAGFSDVDVIGFHGQTIAHEPKGRGTRQVGSGEVIAAALGLPVVWDFRTADVALGGEGAPLASFYHFAGLKWVGVTGQAAVLNLGGVGNLTWLDLDAPTPETPGALLAFDTGPANAPLNDFMTRRRGQPFDEDAALALSGRVDETRLAAFLTDPYFARIPPKSLDRDDFRGLADLVEPLSDADGAATLAAIAAAAAIEGMKHCPQPPERLFVTGGGRLNPAIMAALAERADCPVAPIDDTGLDGDMLEAEAFGYLAVRVLRGLPTTAPGTTGVPAPVAGGQVSGEVRGPRRRQGARA